jgi:hypothetical protein
MPRQLFAPIRKKHPGGNITIGTPVIGERPELETVIGNCLLAWPIAESEMGLTLGQLLGIGNEAALAVYSILRRATAQQEAIYAAARIALNNDAELELVSALIAVHKSIEAERTALAHGHFGTYDKLPDAILWMTTTDYVQLKAKLHLANMVMTDKMRDNLYSSIFVYKKPDLKKIYEDILYCAAMWPEVTTWLKANGRQREAGYRQLCSQSRIAQALVTLRQKNKTSAPPQ